MPTPDPASPADAEPSKQVRFHFAPNMGPLLNPAADQVPVGTDAWAFANGYVSVTPIRAEYGALYDSGRAFGSKGPEESAPGTFW